MMRYGPPSPEEIQKQLADFMRQHFPKMPFSFQAKTDSSPASSEPAPQEESDDSFLFNYKPREIKDYLDRFVIKQDEAKKVLSVAMCDHYHHVRLALQGKDQPNYTKQNIILLGPTGVGKTYLVRSIADLIGVPFVKADATKFSETGYVGGDVEDLVRELYRRANNDIKKAQYGIIYIDEIDKIASANHSSGRDVSGRGVQTNLLKLMEETEVPARSSQDIAGQVAAMLDLQQGRKGAATINTKHILFIVSGAFDGLEKIISRRVREASIGFAAKGREREGLMTEASTRDFIDFGFEPEFIGRLPVRVVCQPLSTDDLFSILRNSEGSIIRQYEETFAAYGIEVLFLDEGLKAIAELASHEGTGARGLMTVCERVFRDYKYELPSTQVKRFVVTAKTVSDPQGELRQLLELHLNQERSVARKLVYDFAARFEESHGLKLRFTEEAADALVTLALDKKQPVRELCSELFKDFQFGLKLISQNTNQTEFEVDAVTVQDPQKALSDWVVASYKGQD